MKQIAKKYFLAVTYYLQYFQRRQQKIFKIILKRKLSHPIFAIRSKKKGIVLNKNNQKKQKI